MSMRVLTGANWNLLRRGIVTLSSGTADSRYPLTNVYDQLTRDPLLFTAAGTPRRIDVDLDRLGGMGGFESLTGWALSHTGTGSLDPVLDATNPRPGSSGTKSVKLHIGTSGSSIFSVNKPARAGGWFTLSAWYQTDGGGVAVRLRIQNLQTGHWLKNDGTWSATVAEVISSTTATWASASLAFAVESYSICGTDEVTLAIDGRIGAIANSNAWFDDVTILPGVDTCSMHGHNVPRSVVTTVYSATDAAYSSPTSRAVLTNEWPTCGAVLGSLVYDRYWRFDLADALTTPNAAWWIAEAVLGQSYTFLTPPRHPGVTAWKSSSVRAQVRNADELGDVTVVNLATYPQRIKALPFRDLSTANLQADLVQQLFERSSYGATPVLLFPDSAGTEAIICRIGPRWDASTLQQALDGHDRMVTFTELPHPTLTP